MKAAMAILKIARLGHPILLGTAVPVADPRDPELQRLIADMLETMHDAGGVGLAAPQVHVGLRVLVFRVPPGRVAADPDDLAMEDTALINPELELLPGDPVDGWEGCLSIPGMRARVPRAGRIRYQALDRNGGVIQRVVGGFHARVVQHEVDHLNGVLYPMRMTDFRSFGFTEELARAGTLGG
jgi:peptide deformylase